MYARRLVARITRHSYHQPLMFSIFHPPCRDVFPSSVLHDSKHTTDSDRAEFQNYPKDHKDIELLRLRSYTLGKRLTDEEVTGDDAVQRIASIFEKMEPFVSLSSPSKETSSSPLCRLIFSLPFSFLFLLYSGGLRISTVHKVLFTFYFVSADG